MERAMRKIAVIVVTAFVTACSQAETAQPIVGGDRDEHGCIASAGYRWCAKTAQCERPWELAKAKGFENSSDAFDGYCAG